MAKKPSTNELETQIEAVITRLLKCDTAPHKEQMELLDRALKLVELKKKNGDGEGFGSGFGQT